jgi:TLC domain
VRGRGYTEVEELTIQVSFSYFLVDTAYGLLDGYNDLWMNIHHTIMFASYSISLYSNNVATEMMVSVFFGEVTNPFNLLRQIYAEQERDAESKFQGLLFAGSFIFVRVFIGPVIAWWFCSNPNMHAVLQFGCCAMSRILI